MTLALSKCDTVNRVLSKSLIDGKISDAEFQSIIDEKESYRVQKEILRKGTLPKENKQSSPDIEKLIKDAKQQEWFRIQKKILGSEADISK